MRPYLGEMIPRVNMAAWWVSLSGQGETVVLEMSGWRVTASLPGRDDTMGKYISLVGFLVWAGRNCGPRDEWVEGDHVLTWER